MADDKVQQDLSSGFSENWREKSILINKTKIDVG